MPHPTSSAAKRTWRMAPHLTDIRKARNRGSWRAMCHLLYRSLLTGGLAMSLRLGSVALGVLLVMASCGHSELGSGPCTTDGDCEATERCVDARCEPRPDASSGDDAGGLDATMRSLSGLEITPSAPVLRSLNGAAESIAFEVVARFDDGSSVPVSSAFWSVSSRLLGSIDATTGVFTADGTLAGTVVVTAEALGHSASTTLTVEVEHEILVEGTPADAATRFAGPAIDDAPRAARLLYPLAGAVFPENVHPADVQWEGGVEGDLYRVRLETTGVRVVGYVSHSGEGFGYHWLIDRPAWRALAESAPETDVTVRVDRWEAASGEVIAGTPRIIRFADAVIRGAIYYWDLEGGRIQRIRGDGTGLESFMPNPPPRASDGKRCVACHAVSRDGRKMAAELWDGGDYGAVFDLTADLSGDPAPTLSALPPAAGASNFLTASFNPDGSRLIGNIQTALFLMDGVGATIPSTGLPTTGAAHPSWSPDGAEVAFITNTNGHWGVDFTTGDLAVIDVLPDDAFAPARTIFTGAPRVASRPSWSPDSQWIAFQHGEHSRSFSGTRQPAVVRMVSRDGSRVFDLEALNGEGEDSYYPTFSPFDEGGYFWLAFFSTRDYGNAQVGTRGTGRRQLWVSAVSSSPSDGADPSHPPYWLPHQDVRSQNMAAYWSEEPCVAEGRSCASSGECCSGFCRDTGEGFLCVPPDEVSCSEVGEACGSDADCCEGAGSCIGNRCGTLN